MNTTQEKTTGALSVRPVKTTHKVVATGLPALDSMLGGGLAVGRVTELVGPAHTVHLLAQSCMAAAQGQKCRTGIIDYVHELELCLEWLRGVPINQPNSVKSLPGLINYLVMTGAGLIVVFLGAEIFFDNGIPTSAVDANLARRLAQIPGILARSNTACLMVADWPVMPNGATVVRASGIKPSTGELFLTVTPAIEHRTSAAA